MHPIKILVPVFGAVLFAVAYLSWGWQGVAVVAGGLTMWALLHFTRMMHVLKRASERPIGHVGSAVMLNAKLRPGVALLHLLAITRSLGDLRSPKGQQPEIYRWTDGSDSHVTAEFKNGRLASWLLYRPPQPDAEVAPGELVAPVAGATPEAAALR